MTVDKGWISEEGFDIKNSTNVIESESRLVLIKDRGERRCTKNDTGSHKWQKRAVPGSGIPFVQPIRKLCDDHIEIHLLLFLYVGVLPQAVDCYEPPQTPDLASARRLRPPAFALRFFTTRHNTPKFN